MKANLAAAAVLITGAIAVASCADQRMVPASRAPTSAAPRPNSAPAPAPPGALTWADVPATAGDWRWSMEGGQSVARFAGQLVLRCDLAAHSVTIERINAGAPPSGVATLTIRTQTQVRAFSAGARAGALSVTLPGRDPLLDAMAFSKGRFAVEAAGWPTLYVPSWTEVSRVVEDCR